MLFDHFYGCLVDVEIVETAASLGRLDVLKLLHERGELVRTGAEGVAEGEETQGAKHKVYWGGHEIGLAVYGKHWETVDWLLQNDLTPESTSFLMACAVKVAELELVERIRTLYNVVPADTDQLIKSAAAAKRMDMMNWLFERGFVHEAFTAVIPAVNHDSLEMVKWLLERKLVEAVRVMDTAACLGKLQLATYVYDRYWADIRKHKYFPLTEPFVPDNAPLGCPSISAFTMTCAAKYGHLEVVQWLFESFSSDPDIDLFERNIDEAAKHGHLKVVQYLHEVSRKVAATSGKKRKRGRTMNGTGHNGCNG